MPVVPFLPVNVAGAWSCYPNSYHNYECNDLNGTSTWPHESVNDNGNLVWGKSKLYKSDGNVCTLPTNARSFTLLRHDGCNQSQQGVYRQYQCEFGLMVTDVTRSIVLKMFVSFTVCTAIIQIHIRMVHIPSIAQYYLVDFKQIVQ